jgi:hypothetical protein
MKFLWIIIKKDTVRFWPLLALWLAALTLTTVLAVNANTRGTLDVIRVGQWVLFAVVVLSFVQEDALVGARSYWMTRPIPPGALLAGKLIGLIGWLALPRALAVMIGAHYLGAEWAFTFRLGSSNLLWSLPLILAGGAIAAITTTVVQFALTVIGAVIAVVAVLELKPLPLVGNWLYAPTAWQGKAATLGAITIGGGAICLFAWSHQAFTRNARRSAAIVVGLVIFGADLTALWPRGGFPASHPTEVTNAASLRFDQPPSGPFVWTERNTEQDRGYFHEIMRFRLNGALSDHFFSTFATEKNSP